MYINDIVEGRVYIERNLILNVPYKVIYTNKIINRLLIQ